MGAKMNLYCVGGAAFNIGSQFAKYAGRNDPGFAELSAFYIDASKSNIGSSIPDEFIYLVDGLDGSGKRRDSNYVPLSECSKEVLHQFKPTDVNVVLHSASGGTGSTLGPILVSELLNRGETVIVLLVGSTSSKVEVENTIKTLKSYEMISRKRELPINVHYRENSSSMSRGSVDHDMQMAVMMIAAIFSGSNHELDSSDLKNFINYPRVTSYTPKLSYLDFFSNEIIIGKGQSVVSLVTLVDANTSSDTVVPVEYQAVGYVSDKTKELFTVPLPIHACVISGYFHQVIDALDKRLAIHDEQRQVVVEKPIIKGDEDSTHDGLIL